MGRESLRSNFNKIVTKYSKSKVKNKGLASLKINILENNNNDKQEIIVGRHME